MSSTMPRWPDDDEFDAHPEFWNAVLLARGVIEPKYGGGGTFKDLAYWFETETAAPLTPLMREWIVYVLFQLRDKRVRGGVVRRSERTQLAYDIARRVNAKQKQYRQERGLQRMPGGVTTKMILVRKSAKCRTAPT